MPSIAALLVKKMKGGEEAEAEDPGMVEALIGVGPTAVVPETHLVRDGGEVPTVIADSESKAKRIAALEAALQSWRDNYERAKPAAGGCGWVAVPLHQIDSLLKSK